MNRNLWWNQLPAEVLTTPLTLIITLKSSPFELIIWNRRDLLGATRKFLIETVSIRPSWINISSRKFLNTHQLNEFVLPAGSRSSDDSKMSCVTQSRRSNGSMQVLWSIEYAARNSSKSDFWTIALEEVLEVFWGIKTLRIGTSGCPDSRFRWATQSIWGKAVLKPRSGWPYMQRETAAQATETLLESWEPLRERNKRNSVRLKDIVKFRTWLIAKKFRVRNFSWSSRSALDYPCS